MKSLRKDNFFGKIMNNFLYKNKMFMGGGISLILTVLTLFLVTSCNNILQVQEENKSASLVVTVPGSRAASDNIKSYKVAVIGADEKEVAAKDVGVGGTASFEEMTPGDYTVVVEGYDSENIVIFKGEEKATVVAGESAKVVIKLEGAGFTVILDSNIDGQNPVTYTIKYGEKLPDPVHSKGEGYKLLGWTEEKDGSGTLYGANAIVMFTKETTLYAQWAVITFEKLQSEINSGNTPILIGESFEVTQPVTIGNSVELRAAGKDVVLTASDSLGTATDTSVGAMLSVGSSDTSSQTSFTVTIGSGDYSLTLDGNSHKISGIEVNSSDATVDLMEKSIITKFGGMGIDISAGTVNLKGGNIKANTGDGVYVGEGGIFTMSGSALVQDSVVSLESNATITVSGELTGTVPVATITPATYSTDTQVLKATEGVTLANEVGKFEVTPVTDASGTTIEYDINGEGKLCIPVTDEASLKAALDAGGTVSVSSEISVTTGLTVSNTVTLVAASGGVKIINNISTDETTTATPLFTISTGGTLTLGDGINSLTLDGNQKEDFVVEVNGGELVMKDLVTIQNAGDSGVYISYGTFTMEGGTISDNTSDSYAGGVHIFEGATFDMNGGIITGNTGGDGDGVFVAGKSIFSMSGDAVVDSSNDVYLNGDAVITVSGELTGTTIPVATITPSSYPTATSSVQVLQEKADSGVNLADVVGKFAVTPVTNTDGTTANYTINTEGQLVLLATNGTELTNALAIGGTIYVRGEISVTTGLTVTNEVTLVGVGEEAKLTNASSSAMFTVSSGGSLTLGDGTSSLTLDGGGLTQCVVNISVGECVLSPNAVITNANESGVVIRANSTFTMEGGEIRGNMHTSNGGGVELYTANSTCVFTMNGGTITDNTAPSGAGVYMTGGSVFTMNGGAIIGNRAPDGSEGEGLGVYVGDGGSAFSMSGDAVVESSNDVYLNGVASITVSGELTGTTTPVATITPSNYGRTTAVVEKATESSVNLSDVVGKFAVTPDEANSTNYTINTDGQLVLLATDEASLKAALTTGGTVYVKGEFEANSLEVSKDVTLVAASEEATITNTSDSNPLFTVSEGTLTLGDEQNSNSLILNGNGKASYIVRLGYNDSGTVGELYMYDNVTLRNGTKTAVALFGSSTSTSTTSFYMHGGLITGNTSAHSDGGGGVYVGAYTEFTMEDGEISRNTVTGSGGGGGVRVNGTFTMTGGKITGNEVTSPGVLGGGVCVSQDGTFDMGGGEISDNTADYGAEVYVDSSGTTDKGTFKMGGDATLKGGEVYLYNYKVSVPITLTSSLTSSDSPVATIKVASYTNSYTKVLTDDSNGSLVSSEASKFAVTPNGYTNYTINSSGELVAK